MIIALVSVVVVGALIIGGALMLTGGDKNKDDEAKTPTPTPTSESPSPSESEPESEETDEPWVDPSETPTDLPSFSFDPEAIQPTPSSGPQPAYQLRPGDCFDMSEEREGHNEKIACSESHDGEVVHREKLKEKEYASDSALSTEANTVCKSKLQAKANKQPAGSKFRTLAQFPKKRGYDTGMRTVTCSLVAQEGQKLSSKLR